MKQHTRKGDILARYEEDEFIAVLKQIHSDEAAVHKGEEICKAFYEEQSEEAERAKCSVGIAMCTEEAKLSRSLIKRADEALSRVKQKENGGCLVWKQGITYPNELS